MRPSPQFSYKFLHYLLISIFTCIPAFLLLSSVAHASPTLLPHDTISITDLEENIDYPRSITFSAHATSSANITQAVLVFKIPTEKDAHRVTLPITASTDIQTSHTYEMKSYLEYIPAGGNITYHWEFTDSVHGTNNSSDRSFMVMDNRFTWTNLKFDDVPLTLYWYNQPASFGQGVAEAITRSLNHIKDMMGNDMTLKVPTTFWVYNDIDEFRGAIPLGSHDWSGGMAFLNEHSSYLPIEDLDDEELIRGLPHELTHVVFAQYVEQANLRLPAWFEEGLAMNNQFYQENEFNYLLNKAVNENSLLPLSQISNDFPDDSLQADLAYAQSWKVISYMYDTYGKDKMTQFYDALRTTKDSFGSTMQKTLGVNVTGLEKGWHKSLNIVEPGDSATPEPTATPVPQIQVPEPATDSLAPVLMVGGVLVITIALITLLLLIKRQQDRKRLFASVENHLALNRYTPTNYTQPSFYENDNRNPIPGKGSEVIAFPEYVPETQPVVQSAEELLFQPPQEFPAHPEQKAPQE